MSPFSPRIVFFAMVFHGKKRIFGCIISDSSKYLKVTTP